MSGLETLLETHHTSQTGLRSTSLEVHSNALCHTDIYTCLAPCYMMLGAFPVMEDAEPRTVAYGASFSLGREPPKCQETRAALFDKLSQDTTSLRRA